jgi:hypothetical protein
MPYICYTSHSYKGNSHGTGQCVDLVKIAARAPATFMWKQGEKVKGNKKIIPGTAIATFQHGAYQNKTDGSSHAAIYLSQDPLGIYVIDQWIDQVAERRPIRFRNGTTTANNDGDAYFVIE